MSKSEKFVQVRKFFFAQSVAEADYEACKAGNVPFILTKAAAKAYYAKATKQATAHQH